MTITSPHPSSIKALIDYCLNPQKRFIDSLGKDLVYGYNLLNGSNQEIADQFWSNAKSIDKRNKRRIRCHHFILSAHPEDSHLIDSTFIRKASRKFIGLLNKKAQYLSIAHGDTEHRHVHIICSAHEYESKKAVSIRKKAFSELQQEFQFWLAKSRPDLRKSLVGYGHKERMLNQTKHSEYQIKKKNRTSKKELLRQQTEQLYLKSQSLQDFTERLSRAKISPYWRNNQLTGVITQSGRKYRFSTLLINQNDLQKLDQRKVERDQLNKEHQQPHYQSILDEIDEIRNLNQQHQEREL